MSLLGRDSTIDVALKDVRRGLADAEAFMEICRFKYKHLRPPPDAVTKERLWDLPDLPDDFAAQALREPTVPDSLEPLAAESSTARATDTVDQPVEELPPVIDTPSPVVDLPLDDEPDWPEMPDFLVRRN